MATDCYNIKSCSNYVELWCSKQPNVGEESLTDWLLFELSYRIDSIMYYKFTKYVESHITGADWEWWFIFDDYSYKLRIQAKMIDKNNASAINYTNTAGEFQIEKLLEDSKRRKAVPLYAFYAVSSTDPNRCCATINNEGVILSSANEIYNNFFCVKKVDEKDVRLISTPLSCLICCNHLGTDTTGIEFYNLLERQFKVNSTANPDIQYDTKKLPKYVTDAIYKFKADGTLPENWDKDFEDALNNINALVIYDNRSKNSFATKAAKAFLR